MPFKKDYRVIAAGTTATLYTVPLGSEASAPTLTLTATGAATATVTIFVKATGLPVDVISGLALTANTPHSLDKPLMLNEQDEIRVSVTGADVGSVLGVYEDSPAGQAVIFNARGAYNAVATYDKGDVVDSSGTSYIALTDGLTGDAPPSVNWMINASKGDTGPMDPAVYDPQTIAADAFARASHTGTQAIATITNLQSSLDAKLAIAGGTATGTIQFDAGAREPALPMPADDISMANGGVQTRTLTANATFTESLADGDSVLLHLAGGDTYSVTWPTMTWVGGSAPTLTADDVLVIWQRDTTVYGNYLGSVV